MSEVMTHVRPAAYTMLYAPHQTRPGLARSRHLHVRALGEEETEREDLDQHLDDEISVEHVVEVAQENGETTVGVAQRVVDGEGHGREDDHGEGGVLHERGGGGSGSVG